MIIYNVSIIVEQDVATAWVEWMKSEHIPDLMSTGQFIEARLCRLLEQDETDGVTYVAQYHCVDFSSYNAYLEQHASQMREKAFAKFGNKFVAMRTVMEVIE